MSHIAIVLPNTPPLALDATTSPAVNVGEGPALLPLATGWEPAASQKKEDNQMTRLHMASIIAASLCLTVVAKADWKVQSGVTCQARDPDASKVFVDASGITAEAAVNVYCPILRDTNAALSELNVGFIGIADDEVECTLFTKSLHNTTNDSVTDTLDTNGFTFGTLSMDLTGFDEGTDKIYVLRCSLETDETLVGIDYTE